jgi:hypothetical protein
MGGYGSSSARGRSSRDAWLEAPAASDLQRLVVERHIGDALMTAREVRSAHEARQAGGIATAGRPPATRPAGLRPGGAQPACEG